MITHRALWKLHDHADGRSREENSQLAKSQLEALLGKIPGLLHIEVGMDVLHTDASADLCLYAHLESLAALEAYQVHPEHQAVVPLMKRITSSRTVIDYES